MLKEKRGVRDDECAAGVDVQRLQFVKTETRFLNPVLPDSDITASH